MQCLGSSDCAGLVDAGSCCATAYLLDNPDGAAFPHCNVASITSYCSSSCPAPALEFSCETAGDASVEQVQACTQTSDCAHAPNGQTSCCAVLSYHVCLSAAAAGLEQLTCLP